MDVYQKGTFLMSKLPSLLMIYLFFQLGFEGYIKVLHEKRSDAFIYIL